MPVQLLVVALEISHLHHFFEENVQLSAAISSEIVVLDHFHNLCILKFADFFCHLPND